MNAQITRAAPKTLMSGIRLGESARWHDGRFWFADWMAETLYSLDEEGGSEIVASVASIPFCFDWLPDGRLLVLNSRDNQLQVRGADGGFSTFADLAPVSRKPWNEVVVDVKGNVFMNNIGFEFPGGEFVPGFIAVLTPGSVARRVAEGLAFPNGMAVTPDGSTLIVAESYAKALTAFTIDADGGLSNRRVWAELDGHPDGISVDAEGAIWAGAGPQCLRIAEGGQVLDAIALDRMCFSCALGGADGKTLMMVAAQWGGDIDAMAGEPTGKVFTSRVSVPRPGAA